jgi:hypothetical protein
MRRNLGVLVAVLAGGLAAAVAPAVEKEQRIQKADLPEAVQATAERESAGGTVREYAKAIEKGQVVYAMDVSVNGRAREVLIGADGNVVAVREDVPFAQLPPEIQAGLKQQAGKGKIGKVIAVSKNTAVLGYEASVAAANGKTMKVEVGVDGKPPAPSGSPEPVP